MKKIVRKTKTVAIVGKNALNWDLAPFEDKEVDIWGISYWAALGKYPRLDAVFEVHRKKVWKMNINMPAAEYLAWLGQKHDFPIYTQHKFKAVPSSVKFPMKEIQDLYFQRLYRGKNLIGQFFTSSMAYMMALALYQGYSRIEVYGIEMDAERYQYQRDSVFWWMGMANGLGVEVVVPENSHLYIVNHYGDAPDPYIMEIERQLAQVQVQEAEKMKSMAGFYKSKEGLQSLHDAMHNNYLELVKRDAANEHGAALYLELHHEDGTNITKQELEHMIEFYGQDLPGCVWEMEGDGRVAVKIKHP
jgi:hypothetical protein